MLFFILALIAVAIFNFISNRDESGESNNQTTDLPLVELTSARKFSGEGSISLIGSVRAFSETALTAEASGRITSVPVALGDSVFAGQVIATIENASEQAAVLQAEGAYEAALASANQNPSGANSNRLENKKDELISVMKKAYVSSDNIIRSTVDLFIDEPNSRFPEFSKSLSDYFLRQDINAQRRVVQDILES
jgi:multidrug efflux pump subunit AcrA (membrane-fusion protein)